jgi:hypothetical protein
LRLKNNSSENAEFFLNLADFFSKSGRQIFLGPGNSVQCAARQLRN